MIDFRGRRALVTGASKGIGEACATTLAKHGAAVVVHYRTDEASAERVVRAITDKRGTARAIAADLSRWDEGERLVAEAERELGPLDVLVLNHGVWKEARIELMLDEQYTETLDANLRGYFSVAGAAARRMGPRGKGSIVMIASTAGQRGEAAHSHYAATKGAIISLTKSLASELAPRGIRVNCVAPGWVRTPMTEPTLRNERGRAAIEAVIPLGRVGEPSDIAGPVAFLASDAASFVTGEIFNVNGGAVLVG